MQKKTVLLTGATGFLGSHILKALIQREYKVLVLKRSSSDLWRIEHLIGQFESYDVDIHPIEKAFEGNAVDCVIHTACHYGRDNSPIVEVVKSNLLFGLKLFQVAIRNQIDCFINTDSFLPRDLNAYSLSKKQFFEWLKLESSKTQVINLKLEHMYGPKDDSKKFIVWLFRQLAKNKPYIDLTSGVQKRDFIYIEDVVSAFMVVLDRSSQMKCFSEFEVGTGESIEVRAFVTKLKQVYENMYGPRNTLLNFGAIPYREGEVMEFMVNNQALLDLGWYPEISLNLGLEETLKDVT